MERIGAAAEAGVGCVFVGAGPSVGAGLPDWGELLREPRAETGAPDTLGGLPLLADYYEQNADGADRR